MYKLQPINKNTMQQNKCRSGETIEKKIARIINNKEPIKDNAPIVYTERKDGVRSEFNIRTDRFDEAIQMADVISATERAKRAGVPTDKILKDTDGTAESIDATK